MGIHVGSFTLGGIVGAGVLGYFVMKSPIGCEIKQCALDVAKKKAEEGIHFLLWGDSDKRGPGYKECIPRNKKGRPDYTSHTIKSKDDKVDEVYFITEEGAKSVFSAIRAEIQEYGCCSITEFLEIAAEQMTNDSVSKIKTEYSDCNYGWDWHDLAYFKEEWFYSRYISGKGWQFLFPTVHKIGV